MRAASLRLVILVVAIAIVGTGLRDFGLSKAHVFGLFFGAIIGGTAALLRLWLSGKSDMGWPLAGALAVTLIVTFLRDMGTSLPFTERDYQEGTFCGLLAGAAAIWLRWPPAEIISKISSRKENDQPRP